MYITPEIKIQTVLTFLSSKPHVTLTSPCLFVFFLSLFFSFFKKKSKCPPGCRTPTLINKVPFSKNGLQVLAIMYLGGLLLRWDQHGVFEVLFGSGSVEPEMFVLKWDLTSLLSEIIFVLNPGTPDACILRLNMAPEYMWLGIHWAGTPQTGMYALTLLSKHPD